MVDPEFDLGGLGGYAFLVGMGKIRVVFLLGEVLNEHGMELGDE